MLELRRESAAEDGRDFGPGPHKQGHPQYRGQSNGLMSSAGATAGLIAGGYDTANRNATEEFTGESSALGFSTITTS